MNYKRAIMAPNSWVMFYKNVEISRRRQLVFTSQKNRNEYMQKRRVGEVSAGPTTYIYKGEPLLLPKNYSIDKEANYMSFVNPDHEGIVYYAFITNIERVNEGVMAVFFEVDWFQTHMFNKNLKFSSCQIRREHTSQADWDKLKTNPWAYVPEMETGEDITPTDDHYYFPEEGRRVEVVNPNSVLFANTSGGRLHTEISGDKPKTYAVLYVSPLGEIEGVLESTITTLGYKWNELFSVGVKPSDVYYMNITEPFLIPPNGYAWYKEPPTDEHKVGSAPYIFVFPNRGSVNLDYDAQVVYDIMTRQGVSHSVVGAYSLTESQLKDLVATRRAAGTLMEPWQHLFPGNPTFNKQAFLFPKDALEDVVDPKLKRYPFSFIVVSSPSGARKEYRIEGFRGPESENSDTVCTFVEQFMDVGSPTMFMAPFGYGGMVGVDTSEAMTFSNFPQLALATDSYLTFQAANYQNALMESTKPAQINRTKSKVSQLTAGAGAVVGGLMTGRPLAALAGAGGVVAGEANRRIDDATRENALSQGRYGGVGGPVDIYENAKPAFASYEYSAPVINNGLHAMYQGSRFEYMVRRPTQDFIRSSEEYFRTYGYTSQRTGIPRIVNYFQNRGGAESKPKFHTVDDVPTTFVQTANCKVEGVHLPALQYIESLFDGGMTFVKGDGR